MGVNFMDFSKNLIWNEQNHNDLLKIISYYYIPIKTIDSSHSSFYLNASKSELTEIDLTFLNIVVKEIEINSGNLNINVKYLHYSILIKIIRMT